MAQLNQKGKDLFEVKLDCGETLSITKRLAGKIMNKKFNVTDDEIKKRHESNRVREARGLGGPKVRYRKR